MMLLRTVDRVLDIGKLVLVHQKPILNGFKVQALGSVMAHRTSLKKLLSMLPIKTLLSSRAPLRVHVSEADERLF